MIKKFKNLPEDAKIIREEVFMNEQGFQNEFDDIDERATHLVFYDQGIPVATCRYFPGKVEGEFVIGRVATRKKYRGKQLGKRLLEVAEYYIREEGGTVISLSAQVRVMPFYEQSGYHKKGKIYMDEFCEHIYMEKKLNK